MQLPDDPNQWSWLRVSLYAAFAALGGVLGHIMRAIDRKERVVFVRAIIEGIAAGFVGLLVLFLCQAMHLSEQWTGVIVGVSGWLGANATIRLIETLVYRKLGLTNKRRKDDDG